MAVAGAVLFRKRQAAHRRSVSIPPGKKGT
jgi:hypothetical protein